MQGPHGLQHGLPVELDVERGQVPLLFDSVLQVLVKVKFSTLHQNVQQIVCFFVLTAKTQEGYLKIPFFIQVPLIKGLHIIILL